MISHLFTGSQAEKTNQKHCPAKPIPAPGRSSKNKNNNHLFSQPCHRASPPQPVAESLNREIRRVAEMHGGKAVKTNDYYFCFY
jgi:hypothetical protein